MLQRQRDASDRTMQKRQLVGQEEAPNYAGMDGIILRLDSVHEGASFPSTICASFDQLIGAR
jgi:hypothetical protein